MTNDKATALREVAEAVFSEITLIDACGQICVDGDSIERGVRKALEPLLAERERLRGALEASATAFSEIAFLRPGGPLRNPMIGKMERIAIDARDAARQALEATDDQPR